MTKKNKKYSITVSDGINSAVVSLTKQELVDVVEDVVDHADNSECGIAQKLLKLFSDLGLVSPTLYNVHLEVNAPSMQTVEELFEDYNIMEIYKG